MPTLQTKTTLKIQSQTQLYSEFKTSVRYMRISLKKAK